MLLFEETTPLGTRVRTSSSYWERIVQFKHPVMHGKEELVRAILRNPMQIRQSRKDRSGHLYYGLDSPYYACKEGDILWHP